MAARTGKNTGLIVTLIFFVVAFLVSVILAIMFYTKIEEAKNGQAAAQATLARFVDPGRASDSEYNDIQALARDVDPNMKIVPYLITEMKTAKIIAAGSDTITNEAMRNKLEALGANPGANAIDYAATKSTDLDNALANANLLDADLKALEERIKAGESLQAQIRADMQTSSDRLETQLTKLAADMSAYESSQKSAPGRRAEKRRHHPQGIPGQRERA